jgi:hypothetical protein
MVARERKRNGVESTATAEWNGQNNLRQAGTAGGR